MRPIITATNISKKYNHLSEQSALKNTQFTVGAGEIHVIEGKSGSGKSTLLNILGGMENPSLGHVYYRNRSFYDLDDKEQALIRGEKFGFVFQSFELIPELTVKENIELPLQFNSNTHKYDVNKIAQELELEKQLHKKPAFLSGGEQQRVAIARAIITSPDVIFADEPTGNLDEATSKKVVCTLEKLVDDHGVSLVVVTHEKNLFAHKHNLYSMENGVLHKVNKDV